MDEIADKESQGRKPGRKNSYKMAWFLRIYDTVGQDLEIFYGGK